MVHITVLPFQFLSFHCTFKHVQFFSVYVLYQTGSLLVSFPVQIMHHRPIHVRTLQSGLTGLHVASFCGHPALVEQLLSHGADVSSSGQRGETPLHLAAVGSTTNIATQLLHAGAHVNDSAQVRLYWNRSIRVAQWLSG